MFKVIDPRAKARELQEKSAKKSGGKHRKREERERDRRDAMDL